MPLQVAGSSPRCTTTERCTSSANRGGDHCGLGTNLLNASAGILLQENCTSLVFRKMCRAAVLSLRCSRRSAWAYKSCRSVCIRPIAGLSPRDALSHESTIAVLNVTGTRNASALVASSTRGQVVSIRWSTGTSEVYALVSCVPNDSYEHAYSKHDWLRGLAL
eukprot:3111417-Prymnesium_polylepis.5